MWPIVLNSNIYSTTFVQWSVMLWQSNIIMKPINLDFRNNSTIFIQWLVITHKVYLFYATKMIGDILISPALQFDWLCSIPKPISPLSYKDWWCFNSQFSQCSQLFTFPVPNSFFLYKGCWCSDNSNLAIQSIYFNPNTHSTFFVEWSLMVKRLYH